MFFGATITTGGFGGMGSYRREVRGAGVPVIVRRSSFPITTTGACPHVFSEVLEEWVEMPANFGASGNSFSQGFFVYDVGGATTVAFANERCRVMGWELTP